MSSLIGLNNADHPHFLTERSFLLRPETDILGSEIVRDTKKIAELSCGSSAYVSDGEINNYYDANKSSFGRLVQSWPIADRLQSSLRSSHGILLFALT